MSEIDVILPTYNNASFLDRAISHILAQDFKDFTFIIVNDGSSDNTMDTLSKLDDKRIKIVDNGKNEGLPFSLNIGHSKGSSPYCTWISTDNVSAKNHLSSLYNCMKSGDYDFVQGNYVIVNNGKRSHKDVRSIHDNWGYGNLCPTFLYKRLVWETYNYDVTLPCAEDLKFYLQAFLHPFKFGYVNDFLVDYYVHSASLTTEVHKDLVSHQKKIDRIYSEVIKPYLMRNK